MRDTIKQNIGGLLVRNIHHYNDFHSYDYDIEYSYSDKFDSINKIDMTEKSQLGLINIAIIWQASQFKHLMEKHKY